MTKAEAVAAAAKRKNVRYIAQTTNGVWFGFANEPTFRHQCVTGTGHWVVSGDDRPIKLEDNSVSPDVASKTLTRVNDSVESVLREMSDRMVARMTELGAPMTAVDSELIERAVNVLGEGSE